MWKPNRELKSTACHKFAQMDDTACSGIVIFYGYCIEQSAPFSMGIV